MTDTVQVGSFLLKGTLLLSPLAGVTDFPFRLLCHEQGCAMSVTEMISAKGYLLAPPKSRAARELMLTSRAEKPVALQIFGSTPKLMAEAASRLTDGDRFALLDINMGCPAPKITGGGEGSALLKTPQLAEQIAQSVVKASRLPVTVKIRKGWDAASETYLEVAKRLQDAGVSAITLHGRTRQQFYEGEADWDAIARLKQEIDIPVIGNGDVRSHADARRMREYTGCDAVMIGRGAMGNPWIFSQDDMPDITERIDTALRHVRMLCAWKGELIAVKEIRKHVAWYVRGISGAASLRATVNHIEHLNELESTLRAFEAAHIANNV